MPSGRQTLPDLCVSSLRCPPNRPPAPMRRYNFWRICFARTPLLLARAPSEGAASCHTIRDRAPPLKGPRLVRYRVYAQSPYWHCGFQRVWLKHNLKFKGWNSQAHGEFPGKFESSHVSKDNVSREIGRIVPRPVHMDLVGPESWPASTASRRGRDKRGRRRSAAIGGKPLGCGMNGGGRCHVAATTFFASHRCTNTCFAKLCYPHLCHPQLAPPEAISHSQLSQENMTTYGNMWQHIGLLLQNVRTENNTWQSVWDLWPFCKIMFVPTQSGSQQWILLLLLLLIIIIIVIMIIVITIIEIATAEEKLVPTPSGSQWRQGAYYNRFSVRPDSLYLHLTSDRVAYYIWHLAI